MPIVLGAVAAAPLLKGEPGYELLTGVCALLAGLFPAIYKGLDFDVSLSAVAQHARQFKILQDHFRQAWRVTALESPDEFQTAFKDLMARMGAARAASLTPPERFFKKAQTKIESGHYTFKVDSKSEKELRK